MKKTPKKKSESMGFESKYKIVELPCDNSDMETYIQENRKEINNKIVKIIEYAVTERLDVVELFCFKNSSFVVVLHVGDFKESLENIFELSMNDQQFEICARIKNIINKLDRLGIIFTYKKIKK